MLTQRVKPNSFSQPLIIKLVKAYLNFNLISQGYQEGRQIITLGIKLFSCREKMFKKDIACTEYVPSFKFCFNHGKTQVAHVQ